MGPKIKKILLMSLKIVLFVIAFAIEFFLMFSGIPGFIIAVIIMLVFVYSGFCWKSID